MLLKALTAQTTKRAAQLPQASVCWHEVSVAHLPFTQQTSHITTGATEAEDLKTSTSNAVKQCSRCWAQKPVDQFWKRRRSLDGLQLACIDCQKLAAKEISQDRIQWPAFDGTLACNICKQAKDSSKFSKRVGTVSGFQYECKQCANDRLALTYKHSYHAPAEQKQCRRCKVVKQSGDFHKHSAQKDGMQSCCKDCAMRDAYQRYVDPGYSLRK